MKRTINLLPESRNPAVMQREGDRSVTEPIARLTLTALLAGLPPLDREDGIESVDRPEPDPVDS